MKSFGVFHFLVFSLKKDAFNETHISLTFYFFSFPTDVAGGSDGSVRMFEFIHPDQIALFRPPGQNERVNKIAFNPMGNKVR